METMVFDASRPIAINLRTPNSMKTVRVRFPSDEEWMDRQRRRKVIVKQLGRGISETSIPDFEDADAALLGKIRVSEENASEVDAFEASRIIEQLSQAEVDDVAQEGDAFRVTLRCARRHRGPCVEDAFGQRCVRIPPRIRPRARSALQPPE